MYNSLQIYSKAQADPETQRPDKWSLLLVELLQVTQQQIFIICYRQLETFERLKVFYSLHYTYVYIVCRDSSFGIATRNGLDGSGFKSRWGEIFRTRPDCPWGPPSLLYNGYRGVALSTHPHLAPRLKKE